MTRYRTPRAIRAERGAVLPWFAIWLPVFIIFVVFVVDVANWYEHKRHLQIQADAAALAGAGKFRLPISTCDDTAVKREARTYAGDHRQSDETLFDALWNDQVGNTPWERLHGLINFDPKNPSDPDYPGKFWRKDTDDDGVSPCAAKFIEVKMTEKDLPWFFGLPPFKVPWIDARARVSLMQLSVGTGLLPIAVPDIDPTIVRAMFVDECTGATIASTNLIKQSTLDNGLVVWMNNGTGLPGDPGPVGVSMPTCKKVGVRISLTARGTSTDCSNQFVDCFDLASPNGISFIRSYPVPPPDGSATAPQLRGVELVPATTGCADPYFFSDKKPCGSMGVSAKIDFGLASGVDPSTIGAEVKARFNGGNPAVGLTWNSATDTWFTSGAPFSLLNNQNVPLEGPLPVTLEWKTNATCGNKKCSGDFDGAQFVQRSFGAVDNRSGPIKMLQVFESGVERNAYAAGTLPQLIVRIAMPSNLKVAASVSDPPVALRILGNQTQALNCDVDLNNLSDELAYGCGQRLPPADPTSPFAEAYTPNDGQLNCRDTNKVELWAMASGGASNPEWPCVAISTGHATNQIPKGLNLRVLGDEKPSVCPPTVGDLGHNNWSMYDDPGGLPDGDPRIIFVILTPFGAFAGTGNDETVPVTGFATFYVTGWTGQGSGFDNPCQANGDDLVPNNDPGTIVGHFITYIEKVNSGTNGQACDESSLTPCVAVLTE